MRKTDFINAFFWSYILIVFVLSESVGLLQRGKPYTSAKLIVHRTSYDILWENELRYGRTWSGSKMHTFRLSSITATDTNAFPAHNRFQPNQKRFIHPQVIKMYKRAQNLIRNGDNHVARKLLSRCIELNPRDAHRYCFSNEMIISFI